MTNTSNKTIKKLLYSVGLSIFMLFIFLLTNDINYEIADNQTFSQYIADGEYTILFIGYFLTTFCGFVQHFIYPINAFVLIHLVLAFISFTSVTYVFMDKFGIKLGTLPSVFTICFFGVSHYSTISFTRLPGLLCTAGFLCIIHFIYKNKGLFGVVFGGFLITVGSFYRFKIFETALVIAVLFVMALSTSEHFSFSNPDRSFVSLLKRVFEPKRIIACIVVTALCFGFNFISKTINTSSNELKYFKEWTTYRSSVWDYAIPKYEEAREAYDKIGIDENDLLMLENGYMDNDGAFSKEKLKEIRDIQAELGYNKLSGFELLKTMVLSEFANMRGLGDKGIAALFFGMITFVFLILFQKRTYFIPLSLLTSIFIFYTYLWSSSRVPFRAVYVLWVSAIIYLLYSFNFDNLRSVFGTLFKKKRVIVACISFVLSIVLSISGFALTGLSNDALTSHERNEKSELQKYVESNPNEKFLCTRGSSIPKQTQGNILLFEEEITNAKTYSCTYYAHPHNKEILSEFGLENIYSGLLEKDVYLIDRETVGHVDMFKNYLQKHYGEGKMVEYELHKQIAGFNIYKFKLV